MGTTCRKVRLADRDEAGAAKACGEFGICIGDVTLKQCAAFAEGDAGHLGDEIFHQERHAGEGALGHRGSRLFAGALEHARDDGVQLAVDRFAAPDRLVDEFDRLDRAAADACRQSCRIGVFQGRTQLSSEPGPSSIRNTLNSRDAKRQPASVFTYRSL
jgi:hypothetical protein